MTTFKLHLPDEPEALADEWLEDVANGRDLESVLLGESGLSAWLWRRWKTVSTQGFTEEDLAEVVRGSQREVWLWMAGERTWEQACAGLLGRIERRLPIAALAS